MEGLMDDPSIAKGKRTKRQRLQFPSSATAAAASSSSTSAEFSEITTEEEEDMANCLILLAQGAQKPDETTTAAIKFTSRRFTEAATTTSGKAGFYVYECKTCSKCFPSFQALGGHRASHKKPKLSIPPASSPADETKTAVMGEDSIQLSMNSFSLQAAAKARIHECSICHAEFNSGQALGGHMRRHRPVSLQETAKKEGNYSNGLSLDLNLPAPAEDDGDLANSSSPVSGAKTPPFSFASKISHLTSALVGCHY